MSYHTVLANEKIGFKISKKYKNKEIMSHHSVLANEKIGFKISKNIKINFILKKIKLIIYLVKTWKCFSPVIQNKTGELISI